MIRKLLNRRTFLVGLGVGLTGLGMWGSSAGRGQPTTPRVSSQSQYRSRHARHHTDEPPLDPAGRRLSARTKKLDPMSVLTSFEYGKVSRTPEGRTVREYTFIATEEEVQIAEDIGFAAWMFNGRIPGPTVRCTEGDLIRWRFINQTPRRHSIHIHGFKPAEMDGVDAIEPEGGEFVYEFLAEPFGLFPYHCHIQPVSEHIQRGLYGALIIDPKTPRPTAKELIFVLNGYDLDGDWKNELYSINGVAGYFLEHPIPLQVGEPVRIYLLNMTEFEPAVSLHLHASMFHVYRSGSWLMPHEYTDIVTLAQAERAILEFTYKYPGRYMFHPHQNVIAERGMMGFFEVR